MSREEIYQRGKLRRFLDQVHDVMRVKDPPIRTERSYIGRVKRFILFHDKRHPKDMGEPEVELFLTWLGVEHLDTCHLASNQGMLMMFMGPLSKKSVFPNLKTPFSGLKTRI